LEVWGGVALGGGTWRRAPAVGRAIVPRAGVPRAGAQHLAGSNNLLANVPCHPNQPNCKGMTPVKLNTKSTKATVNGDVLVQDQPETYHFTILY
jgi:hypothetical protein